MRAIGISRPKAVGFFPTAGGYLIEKGMKQRRMISVTKEEARILREQFPEYSVVRTMKQDSKRHHYYATEYEGMMRAIVDTNSEAAKIVAEIDRRRKFSRNRQNRKRG